MPIWLVFSWLIRQMETWIEPDKYLEGNETELKDMKELKELAIEVEVDPFEPVLQVLKIGIAAFSGLLLSLSISAYWKTALKGIICAAIAFRLFAVQLFFDYLEDAIKALSEHTTMSYSTR